MHSVSSDSNSQRPKLVIVCLRSDVDEVRLTVHRHARDDWERLTDIQIVPVAVAFNKADAGYKLILAERKTKVLRRIANLVPVTSAAFLLIAHSTRILPRDEEAVRQLESDDLRKVIPFRSIDDLDRKLCMVLHLCGLDWETVTTTTIGHYYQHQDGTLPKWLEQFRAFERDTRGDTLSSRDKQKFAWMGKALLQMLDFWTAPRITAALFTSGDGSELLDEYDIITYNDASNGSSGMVVARLLEKRRPELKHKTLPLRELSNATMKGGKRQRIIFLEDCLMTGDECIKVLRNRCREVALHNRIDFKYAVQTEYGCLRVKNYLRREGLNQIAVIESPSGHINNMTSDCQALLQAGRLFDGNDRLINPGKQLINGIELRGKRFLAVEQRRNLQWFCRTVGKQLMFQHFQSQGESAAEANDKASENSLGYGDMGLTVAFTHGVPDNSLPLLRCGGKVSVNGQVVNWIPLFPNATGVT